MRGSEWKRGHTLFSEIGLSLFDRADNHIADRGGGHSIEPALIPFDAKNVQVFGSRIVSTIQQGGTRQTAGNLEFTA